MDISQMSFISFSLRLAVFSLTYFMNQTFIYKEQKGKIKNFDIFFLLCCLHKCWNSKMPKLLFQDMRVIQGTKSNVIKNVFKKLAMIY